jgi:hypothetical protein
VHVDVLVHVLVDVLVVGRGMRVVHEHEHEHEHVNVHVNDRTGA